MLSRADINRNCNVFFGFAQQQYEHWKNGAGRHLRSDLQDPKIGCLYWQATITPTLGGGGLICMRKVDLHLGKE